MDEVDLATMISMIDAQDSTDNYVTYQLIEGGLQFQFGFRPKSELLARCIRLNIVMSNEKGLFKAAREQIEVAADRAQIGIFVDAVRNPRFAQNLAARGYLPRPNDCMYRPPQ